MIAILTDCGISFSICTISAGEGKAEGWVSGILFISTPCFVFVLPGEAKGDNGLAALGHPISLIRPLNRKEAPGHIN